MLTQIHAISEVKAELAAKRADLEELEAALKKLGPLEKRFKQLGHELDKKVLIGLNFEDTLLSAD